MAALTEDRNTPRKDGRLIPLGVAADTQLFMGSMVAKNGPGYMVPAADAANLVVMGVADNHVDNSGGQDGEKEVLVRRKSAFLFNNSESNPCTVQHIGGNCYVEDDNTVASSGGSHNVVAGKIVGIESAGVWVEIG